ncbi:MULTISPECIES: helix-turn-helix domain-containing protein [Arcicella]|uniref:Helix-turn-helix domain-containing protein n=1 Tax=Arcicella aquatica TaxID=217141 RepID=A0ABU5QPL4_9BACT|nr:MULTISPECIES: helix-turn-helix domain-containing protein [Arcicella]MDR6562017.1 HTH-type transcriptional regulator/antitoxin HigA [Arcicella sp. BE51]MDR6811889.1 HTH-type transcriptional regulator/antitoxin HigA [Arcicella sp. BE140]MDR6822919.1 HTH-type transcriptional regulator/antitoxin HigA [Arcicella sp. BE139]MEA5259027.1 helix-turn-helix domain-containing protein [Arcicella aquatica]
METKIQIKPITNEQEFAEANELIELLLECPEGSEEEKILEAVTILASEYEKKNYSLPKPNPIEAIRYRMAELQLSQKDVAKYFGGENRVSEVLNGKRQLSLKMIKNLHQNLGISANSLISM